MSLKEVIATVIALVSIVFKVKTIILNFKMRKLLSDDPYGSNKRHKWHK